MFFKIGLLVLLGYLIGSISTGVLISRWVSQKNLQTEGSKNIGATNVARLLGRKWGILTLLGDVLKGMIPIWIGQEVLAGTSNYYFYLCLIALAAFMGHLFPIYLRFKGGKGVATALGIFTLLGPKALLIAIPFFVLIVYFGKYISLGSIVATGSFPVFLIIFHYDKSIILLSIVIAVAIILKHRENMVRLWRGEEKPWQGEKKG
jgi:acyl phosphate:glycerol-3-phosphate acyltransferase